MEKQTDSNTNNDNNRFKVISLIGEGSFSKTYSAFDKFLERNVALKFEKTDKDKRILKVEYEALKALQTSNSVPKVYDFIENSNDNSCIVMDLLGQNVSNYIKANSPDMVSCVNILLQMLKAIENIHTFGYIHRDIKPSNFVLGLNEPDCIYIIDFGLSKKHLDKNNNPVSAKKISEFRGTLTYASMNAHNRKDLGRRDDIWSFYFIILEMLGITLPWRDKEKKKSREEITKNKELCLNNPDNFIFIESNDNKEELKKIFDHLMKLNYESKPNYNMIKECLESIQDKVIFGRSNKKEALSEVKEEQSETSSNKENREKSDCNVLDNNMNMQDKDKDKKLLNNKRQLNFLNLDHQIHFIKPPLKMLKEDKKDNKSIVTEYEETPVENKMLTKFNSITHNTSSNLSTKPNNLNSASYMEIRKDKSNSYALSILEKDINTTSIFDIVFLYHFFYSKVLGDKQFNTSTIKNLIKSRFELIKTANCNILSTNIYTHNLKSRYPLRLTLSNKSNTKKIKSLLRLIHSNKQQNKKSFLSMIEVLNEEQTDDSVSYVTEKAKTKTDLSLRNKTENFFFAHIKAFREFNKRNDQFMQKFK